MSQKVQSDEFDAAGPIESDSLFDHLGVRDAFLEFMQTVLNSYSDSLTVKKFEEHLQYKQIFDPSKFLKTNSDSKSKEFYSAMMSTSMWTKFIENRVKCDDTGSEGHLYFFDKCCRHKRDKKDPNILTKMMKQELQEYECAPCDTEEIKDVFLYDCTFPKLTQAYFSSRQAKILSFENWEIMDAFTSQRTFDDSKETKSAKILFESIHTLWIACLEIFARNSAGKVNRLLYDFAFDTVFNIEANGEFINLQILSSISFLVGLFGNEEDFSKISRKYKSTVKELCVKGVLLSKYYAGLKQRENLQSRTKISSETSYDFAIPLPIQCHFETNIFCQKCNMFIPEELIIAKIKPQFDQKHIECPNPVCKAQIKPKFGILQLKEEGQAQEMKRMRLLTPMRLLAKIGDFLNTRKEL